MHPSPTAKGPSRPRLPAEEPAYQPGGEASDRLSALPDDLLRRIMSPLKAWEVVRTCVLARRWRHLWASAPCLDFRTRHATRDRAPFHLCEFFYRLFLLRDASAPVDTLRLRSSDVLGAFLDDDANAWIRDAMKRNARVIHVVGHRRFPAPFAGVSFVSCHLKILKLSYARLDDRILGELSSGCASLEELDLKDCLVTGDQIVSASLKTLVMLKCRIDCDCSIDAPNLVLLRLITPYLRVPSFKKLGSLVTGTIIIDDYFLIEDFSEDEDCDETTDDDVSDDGNYVSEHVIDQDDSDETSTDDDVDADAAADDDNCNYGFQYISDQEDCDETTVAAADDSNIGSKHIIDQEDCDETTDDDDDDDSSYLSEDITGQADCDETIDDDNRNCASEDITGQDDCDETTDDDDGDHSEDSDKREGSYKTDDESFLIGDVSGYISEDDIFDENADEEDGSDNSKHSKIGYGRGGQKDNYHHDGDIDSDDTYEYSEIARERKYGYHADSQNYYHSYENIEINDSEYCGGQNILQSLSNVTSLGLLTDAGEVVLSRELKTCPTFSNLKILSLGEWCMAAGFDALIFLLQHSPNIERLFLQLNLNFDTKSKKALETSIKLQGRSFTCKDLQMVKIKCSKDDARVHKLANLFIANGVPLEKILVHRSGSAYLRAKELTDSSCSGQTGLARKL